MAPKTDRMYAKSRTIGKDEDGNPTVQDVDKTAGAQNLGGQEHGDAGSPDIAVRQAHERHELHHRHVQERLAMHRRQEVEHAANKSGDKSAMHARHEAELADMQKRHLDEFTAMHDRHEKE